MLQQPQQTISVHSSQPNPHDAEQQQHQLQRSVGAPLATWQDDNGAGPDEKISWYRVSFIGGVALRAEPNFLAARTENTVQQHETFPVSQEIVGTDGRIYLCLADGRGWAFDDSALIPHDPAVVKGRWVPVQPVQTPLGTVPVSSPCPVQPQYMAPAAQAPLPSTTVAADCWPVWEQAASVAPQGWDATGGWPQ